MIHDLRQNDITDNGLAITDRLEKLEEKEPVTDTDGYKMGASFKPPVLKNSKERNLRLATQEEISKTYKRAFLLWEDHPQHKNLKESSKALSKTLGNAKINKLVCFGLGSLSPSPICSLEGLGEAHEEADKKKTLYYGLF